MRRAPARARWASSTASGPSSAAAITASAAVERQARAGGHREGHVERLERVQIEGPAGHRHGHDEHGDHGRADLRAPIADRQEGGAADDRRQQAAARRRERRGRGRAARASRSPRRGGRAARELASQSARGRRERGVGADRVRVAEHALQTRRGLEEDAVRALLDGVGDERQRGGAEHPGGRLERAAQEVREQDAAGARPRRPRASGWRRRRRVCGVSDHQIEAYETSATASRPPM